MRVEEKVTGDVPRLAAPLFISDEPAVEDHLNFEPYVTAVADLIASPVTRTPLVLGILGDWGSGKTTLMGLIRAELANRGFGKQKDRQVEVLNVWQLSLQGDVAKSFLQHLLTTVRRRLPPVSQVRFAVYLLRQRVNISGVLRQLVTNLWRIGVVLLPIVATAWLRASPFGTDQTNAPQTGGVLSAVLALWLLVKPAVEAIRDTASFDLNAMLKKAPYESQVSVVQQLRNDFERLVHEWVGKDGRLVVFVDDLDRCPPTAIPDVLEALKLFVTTQCCIYVLALDQDVIAKSIQLKYKEVLGNPEGMPIGGTRYLEKVIQLPFLFPPIGVKDITRYIEAFGIAWPDNACAEIFATSVSPNPRQIKRAVNVFNLLWVLANIRDLRATVTALRLAKIVALQTAHPDTFNELKNDPRLLGVLESACQRLASGQELGADSDQMSASLQAAARLRDLQHLFSLLGDRDDVRFARLERYELESFFSLTRQIPTDGLSLDGTGAVPTESGRVLENQGTALEADRALTIPSLHQLPTAPGDFTGRADILANLVEVATAPDGPRTIGLFGLGGIGKTTLALKLAEQIAAHYPDAQLFLRMRGGRTQRLTPADAAAQVIRSFDPAARVPEDEPTITALYRSVLYGKRAILIADDVSDGSQVAPLVPPVGSLLLVTSRQQFTMPGLFVKNLDALSAEEAETLLLTIAPRIGDKAKEIARLCGNLPLALRMAASTLAQQPALTVDDYARELTNSQQRLDLVGASINLTSDLLTDELRRYWQMLTVFPETFDQDAAAVVLELNGTTARSTLSSLAAYSLVEINPVQVRGAARYRLHELVRLYAQERLAESERDPLARRHAAHYLEVAVAIQEMYRRGGDDLLTALRWFDLDLPNLRDAQAWSEARSASDDDAARMCSAYPDAAVDLFPLRESPQQRIDRRLAALTAARGLNDRPAQTRHLVSLGIAYADLGDARRAIEFFEQALALARDLQDRATQGGILGNLGLAYSVLGEPDSAIGQYENALPILREVGDIRAEGNTLGNLGLAYQQLGRYEEAFERYGEALEIRRRLGDRRGEASVLRSLADVDVAVAQYEHAIELYGHALRIVQELGDQRGEGATLGNLGLAYAAQGDAQRATELYEQARTIFEQAGDRLGEATILTNLGHAWAARGDFERALNFHEQQLALSRDLGDRRGEAAGLWNMSVLLHSLDQTAEAVECARTALRLFEEIGSPDADRVRETLREWGT